MIRDETGQSLVELLLVFALSAILLPAVLTGVLSSREGKSQQKERARALEILREMNESVRSVRRKGWDSFAVNGSYYPVISGNNWSLVNGVATISGFTRQILISDVFRDNDGKISSQAGIVDPSTKKVVSRVSWTEPYPSSVESVAYLTRYLDNLSVIQTTEADFLAGTTNGTSVTNTAGGEVTLGAGAQANWCAPQDAIRETLTLPKRGNAIYAKQGSAYVASGDGTEGVTFVNVGISNPPLPAFPDASIVGTYSSGYKTNAVFSDGTYVYLATDNGSEQVVILDLTNQPYAKVGTVTIAGGNPGNSVFVAGNILYVTSGDRLYTYDVTVKTGPHSTPLGSRAMWFNFGSQPQARQVVVVGNYAFVGTGNSLFGLQKFLISNGGRTITFKGASNLTWNQQSQGLAVNSSGTRAYVAFNQGAGIFSKGFFIVDVSTDPPWWWPFLPIKGSYNAGATDPRGMAIGTGNKAMIVGIEGSQQYHVIDITGDNPVYCGGLAVASGVYGVASVLEEDGDAYSYLITGESQDQFKIIQGGSGGRYAPAGTFESDPVSLGHDTAFNRLTATVDQSPPVTGISLQVAVASQVSGSCAGADYTYVGPQASTSAYFTPVAASISATIPFGIYPPSYQNPARCFRYKLFLTSTDNNQTPVFYDMTVNYSP